MRYSLKLARDQRFGIGERHLCDLCVGEGRRSVSSPDQQVKKYAVAFYGIFTLCDSCVAILEGRVDPPHHVEESAPCFSCGAEWSDNFVMDHNPGCIWLTITDSE